ncbi:MAG: hypothetical protein ACKO7N_08350 [Candidatus Nitrosotenuis sp.]
MEVKRKIAWWLLLPMTFNFIGGIIAYFILRDDDPKRAKSCLWLGIILSLIGIAFLLIPIIIGISLMPNYKMFNSDFSF